MVSTSGGSGAAARREPMSAPIRSRRPLTSPACSCVSVAAFLKSRGEREREGGLTARGGGGGLLPMILAMLAATSGFKVKGMIR